MSVLWTPSRSPSRSSGEISPVPSLLPLPRRTLWMINARGLGYVAVLQVKFSMYVWTCLKNNYLSWHNYYSHLDGTTNPGQDRTTPCCVAYKYSENGEPCSKGLPSTYEKSLPMDRGTSRNQNILLPATTGNLECRCCQLLIGRKAQETSWWSNGAVSRMFSRSCPWWEGQREEGIKCSWGNMRSGQKRLNPNRWGEGFNTVTLNGRWWGEESWQWQAKSLLPRVEEAES